MSENTEVPPAVSTPKTGIMLFRFKFTSSDLEEVQRKVGRAQEA